jgi:hypothetical protein
MPCYSPLHGYQDVISGGWISKKGTNAHTPMTVACGQCLGCRLDKAQHWTARQCHEAAMWDHNRFITLTYRPPSTCTDLQLQKGLHEPSDYSLHLTHMQKFLKRLRYHFKDRYIRYYGCGEYGEENHRPHYHANLFNMHFPDEQLLKKDELGSLFSSQLLDDIWGYGFTSVAEFTPETAGYVARYCLKKVTGIGSHDKYLRMDLDSGQYYWVMPEFQICSTTRPCKEHHPKYQKDCNDCQGALGRQWYDQYKDDIYPSNQTPIVGTGVINGTPPYYDYLLKKEDENLLQKTVDKRREHVKKNPGEYTPERLKAKYHVRLAQINHLERNL